MRHGRSTHSDARWLAPINLPDWVAAYDAAPIDATDMPPPDVLALGRCATLVLTSDRPRAITSARLIAPHVPPEVNPLWREAELPHLEIGWPKLPRAWWITSLQIAWLMGYSAGCESIAAARRRAERAAAVLEERSKVGNPVVIGHEVFNRLVAMALRKRGWTGQQWLRSRHWRLTTFRASAA